MKSVSILHALILLALLAAMAALYLLYTGNNLVATSAGSTSRLSSTPLYRVEAVKAYDVPDLGTYIGIYARNVGRASIDLEMLKRLMTVYVYDWRGDLVAYNDTPDVFETVRDGVWEPNELVVIEAFVPVSLIDPPGYRVVLSVSGSSVAAQLPYSNIIIVNSTPTCYLVLGPNDYIAYSAHVAPNPSIYPLAWGVSIQVAITPLNDSFEANIAVLYSSSAIPLPFTYDISARATATLDEQGASITTSYKLESSLQGTEVESYTDTKNLAVSIAKGKSCTVTLGVTGQPVTQPTPFYYNGTITYTAAIAGSTLTTTLTNKIVETRFDYSVAQSAFITVTTGYIGVSSITIKYVNMTNGLTETITWTPTPGSQPPQQLIISSDTIECRGGFTPPWRTNP